MLFKVAIHDGNLLETSFSEMGQLVAYICLTTPRKIVFLIQFPAKLMSSLQNISVGNPTTLV